MFRYADAGELAEDLSEDHVGGPHGGVELEGAPHARLDRADQEQRAEHPALLPDAAGGHPPPVVSLGALLIELQGALRVSAGLLEESAALRTPLPPLAQAHQRAAEPPAGPGVVRRR